MMYWFLIVFTLAGDVNKPDVLLSFETEEACEVAAKKVSALGSGGHFNVSIATTCVKSNKVFGGN